MNETKPPSQSPSRAALSAALLLLKEYLSSANKVASRLAWSCSRVSQLLPLDAAGVEGLVEVDIERLDAFLYRFNSLTAIMQDHITRALLTAEEEDISERSRKDQRQLLEKLGALKPQLKFGTIAELRNRLTHVYPDDSAKQAEILNEVYERSSDLLKIYNDALAYADRKFFASELGLAPAIVANANDPTQ